MTSTLSSASSDAPTLNKERDRDRKRSAHWSDDDTDVLVNVLLRHKDTGRSADNGFRPEVWQEAAGLLEGTTYMGGPKTADACKSRWQRLQRDYKAVKEMETVPGFTWDRSTHRLLASPESWKAAEEDQVEVNKYRKIHLPCFDILAMLCVLDTTRGRIRTKGRTSLASVSDTSSMLSISVGSGGPGPQAMQNGHGHHHHQHHHSQSMGSIDSSHQHPHALPNGTAQHDDSLHHQDPNMTANVAPNAHTLAQLHGQLSGEHGVFTWGETGEEDGEGEFDGSFAISSATQPFGLGKRHLQFDPSILAAPDQPHTLPIAQGSPPKKARISHSTSTSNGISIRPQPLPHQSQNQNGHPHSHSHHPQIQTFNFQLASSTTNANGNGMNVSSGVIATSNPNPNHNNGNGNGQNIGIPRSPEFGSSTTSNTILDSHVLQTPPGGGMKPFTPSSTPGANSSVGTNTNGFPHSHSQQLQFPPGLTPIPIPTPISLSAELTAAGLSEAQRRTEALLQLQSRDNDLSDEDLIEVMAEFESNVAAADTYLAIKREALRKMWLANVIKRRKKLQ